MHVYQHDQTPCWSVTGGYVYRGAKYPQMYGHYFFADYCKDSVWTLFSNSGNWDATHQGIFPGNNFSTFGEDSDGELYIAGSLSGTIFHITDTDTSGIFAGTVSNGLVISPNPFTGEVTIKQEIRSRRGICCFSG